MSYFSDASLVYIPAAVRNGKTYSIKPTDGTGDLTFTRASSATRVGPNGYIEKVRENLLTYSNTFSDASWQKLSQGVGSVAVVTPNYTTDPFGGNNAWRFQCNLNGGTTSSDRSWMIKTFTAASTSVLSIYIKLNVAGSKTIVLSDSGGGTQTITNTEWTRISVSASGGAGEFRIGLIGGGGSSDTLDASIAFAQAEAGDVATDYIATTTAAVSVGPVSGTPRLDYLGSDCGRLLLEPQRSNLAAYSEQADNAYWGKYQCTITSNDATSPDGYQNADKIVSTAAPTNNVIYASFVSIAAGAQTISFFVKAGTASIGFLQIYDGTTVFTSDYNLSNGTTSGTTAGATATITTYGNGWYRCTLTATTLAGTHYIDYGIRSTAIGQYAHIWGFQFEASAGYSSSYVPTLGTAVTRVADAAGRTSASALIGQTEGTFVIDIIASSQNADAGGAFSVLFTAGVAGNNFQIYTAEKNLRFYKEPSSIDFYSSVNLVEGQRYKIGYAYKAGDYAFYVNGVQVGTSTNASVPAVSSIYINQFATGTYQAQNRFNQVLLFKTRLTNAQLAELTTL
jgi:hypothetical protein